MATESLPLFPFVALQDGYGTRPHQPWIIEELDGGFSRSRLHVPRGVTKVNTQFLLSDFEVQAFESWYWTMLKEGSLPFRIALLMNESGLTIHDAKFLKPPELTDVNGTNQIRRAQLEAKPEPRNASNDELVIYWYEQMGSQAKRIMETIHQFANHGWPDRHPA